MEREQLTLGALSEMNSSSQTGGYAQTTGGEKGTTHKLLEEKKELAKIHIYRKRLIHL